MKEAFKTLGTIVFAGCALAFTWLVFQIGPSEADASCGSKTEAFAMSQNPVRAALKSPSTASFPNSRANGVSITSPEECAYRVVSFVDAQNGFGATVRSRYEVDLVHDAETGGWTVTDLAIEQ